MMLANISSGEADVSVVTARAPHDDLRVRRGDHTVMAVTRRRRRTPMYMLAVDPVSLSLFREKNDIAT